MWNMFKINKKHQSEVSEEWSRSGIFIVNFEHLWSNDLVVKALDFQSRGSELKTTGWFEGRLSLLSFQGR